MDHKNIQHILRRTDTDLTIISWTETETSDYFHIWKSSEGITAQLILSMKETDDTSW